MPPGRRDARFGAPAATPARIPENSARRNRGHSSNSPSRLPWPSAPDADSDGGEGANRFRLTRALRVRRRSFLELDQRPAHGGRRHHEFAPDRSPTLSGHLQLVALGFPSISNLWLPTHRRLPPLDYLEAKADSTFIVGSPQPDARPIFARFTQDPPTPSIDEFAALAPVDANASKPPLASETLCTIAA